MTQEDINNVLNKRRKRQQAAPKLFWGLAILLILIGLAVLAFWIFGSAKPQMTLFTTETPTPTQTPSPTPTFTPTVTPSPTLTPTVTFTPTPSAPFIYTIQEGDSLAVIAEKFNLGNDGILLILTLNPSIDPTTQIIFPGQEILIPNPGMKLPTATPVPLDTLRRGALLDYTVQPGDSLYLVASRFNSTVEAIVEENELDNANDIYVGQVLQVPVNLVTPTPTTPPTVTPVGTPAGGPTPTPQASGGTVTVVGDCDYTPNVNFMTETMTLINQKRVENGLPELTYNAALAQAALQHSVEMACHDYLSHTGLDGSSPSDRAAAQGYTASRLGEIIYAQPPQYGGNPQAAVTWWMENADDRNIMLDPGVTEIGVGYAYFEDSMLDGYFTVVLASP